MKRRRLLLQFVNRFFFFFFFLSYADLINIIEQLKCKTEKVCLFEGCCSEGVVALQRM